MTMRTKLTLSILFIAFSIICFGQQPGVAIGGTSVDSSAILDLQSTTAGLLVPRMTATQRQNIQLPAQGLIIYETDNSTFKVFDNSNGWIDLTTSLTDNNTLYSGLDFALSAQSCPDGQIMKGIDASGKVVCLAKTCPVGYTQLGSSNRCFKIHATDHTYAEAVADCFDEGGTLCNIDELTYACENRVALGLSFTEGQWLWTNSAEYKGWINGFAYVGYSMYRLTSDGCISPYGPSPMNVNISWTSATSLQHFTCCVDREY